jgi:hypothetical protein
MLVSNRGREETAITNDALIEEINEAYRRLRVATEDLTSADRSLAEHVRKIRLENTEAILLGPQRPSCLRARGRFRGL